MSMGNGASRGRSLPHAAQVPFAFYWDTRLNLAHHQVIGGLLFIAGKSDRLVVTNNELARLLGISRATAIRGLRGLEEFGYIRREMKPTAWDDAAGRDVILLWVSDPGVLLPMPADWAEASRQAG